MRHLTVGSRYRGLVMRLCARADWRTAFLVHRCDTLETDEPVSLMTGNTREFDLERDAVGHAAGGSSILDVLIEEVLAFNPVPMLQFWSVTNQMRLAPR